MSDRDGDEGGGGSPALKKQRVEPEEITADGAPAAAAATGPSSEAVPHTMFTGFAFDWSRALPAYESEPFATFTKGVAWSPDGTCLLTADDDNKLSMFELPPTAVGAGAGVGAAKMRPVLAPAEGETIYDYAWFPRMSSADPLTCVFAASSRDHPIHLWDAFR